MKRIIIITSLFIFGVNSLSAITTKEELLAKLKAGIEQGDVEKVEKAVNKASEQSISILDIELHPLKKGKKALDHALNQEPINKDIILFLLKEGVKLDEAALKTIFAANNEQLIKDIFEQYPDSLPKKEAIFRAAINLENPSLSYIAKKFNISTPQDLLLYGIIPEILTGNTSKLKEKTILEKLFATNREQPIKYIFGHYADRLPSDAIIFEAAITQLKNPALITLLTNKLNITPKEATDLLFYGISKKVPIKFIEALVEHYNAQLTAERPATIHRTVLTRNGMVDGKISTTKATPLFIALVYDNNEAIAYLLEKLPRSHIGKQKFLIDVARAWDVTDGLYLRPARSTKSYYDISLLVKSKKVWQEKLKKIVEEAKKAEEADRIAEDKRSRGPEKAR